MKLIGLYKTREAAAKARELMVARGVGEAQISLLAPEGEGGPRLAAYAASTSAETAWKCGLPTSALTALAGFAITAGSLELGGSPIEAGIVGALAGVGVGLVFGGAIGAIVGRRRHALRADFFEPDAKRGAVALGVLTHDETENEHARYAFRATGALQIESQADGKTRVPAAKAPGETPPGKTPPAKTSAETAEGDGLAPASEALALPSDTAAETAEGALDRAEAAPLDATGRASAALEKVGEPPR